MPKLKTIGFDVLFFAVSAVLLTVIQVPHKGAWLAWAAWVPFVYVCRPGCGRIRLWFTAYFVGTVYWLTNLWWIGLVVVPGYIAFCLYLGVYWPVIALLVQYLRKKEFPLIIGLPLVVLGAEAWQGILITGFSWRLLGHSQYANTALIQIADIFGSTGVSFVVALVNGLAADLVIYRADGKIFRKTSYIKAAVTVFVIAGTLVYGYRRIGQIEQNLEEGPVVGAVQPNIPSHVKELNENAEMILDGLLVKSNKCLDAGAELVAWPETIVMPTMNKSFIRLKRKLEPGSLSEKFDIIISEHARDRGYVLFGSHSVTVEPKLVGNEYVYKPTEQFNSAFLYRPDGKQDFNRFDKIHLVPFGEYIPYKESVPLLYKFLMLFNPYDYDYSLTPGKNYTVFEIESEEKTYHFGTLICYEDTDSEVTRRMVIDDNGVKKVDWLVNISNDGWYVRFDEVNNKVLPSGELSQRTAISVFRAIENRVSILRSVNTGISCVIDPVGRIKNGYIKGNLPEKAMDRQGVEGWFVDRILINNTVTFFSKHGKWPDLIFAAVFVLLILWPWVEKLLKAGKSPPQKM